jgi:hypothetical protein
MIKSLVSIFGITYRRINTEKMQYYNNELLELLMM